MKPVLTRRHLVAVLVAPGTVVLEIAVLQQIFGSSDIPYEMVLCGRERRHLLSGGVDLGDLAPLETLRAADTVMVPGTDDPLEPCPEPVLAALRGVHEAGARLVSLSGGAFLLGRAGILDGRRATTHWQFAERFRREFPLAQLELGSLHVSDGSVRTSAGILSAADLALRLLAEDLGQTHADEIGRVLVSAPPRPGEQAQAAPGSIDVGEPFLRWLRAHLHEPLTLARLAAHARLSERSLVRKFRQATGMTAFDWINRERVASAKVLLERTNQPMSWIADAVGFGSAETLRRHFARHAGTTAGAYRCSCRIPPSTAPECGVSTP